MTLSIGTRLGPYEILESIGAGGMGEVYRAKDTHLDRNVAIKVLPGGFAADSDRLRRFEQEARTVGSLNQNLVTLFDVGSHEGSPYVVMELLEGETLRQKLSGKPLPVNRAVEIARAAAEGLSAAHDKGIIHRDLKPENLFVSRNGRVKILDFGLAKLRSEIGPQHIPSDDQLTQPLAPCGLATDAGMVLGTVGYMSPEQVRGEPLDSRSDIFALGVILWEMFTGDRPFKGPSAVECMNAILKDEPPDLDPAFKLPPVLERIAHTCLAKEPAARFHSAHDLAFALDNLSSGSYSSPHPLVFPPQRSRKMMVIGSLFAALLISAGIFAGWALRGSPRNLPTFRKLTFGRGAIDGARFVPGSHDIANSARWQENPSTVFLLREGSLEPRALDVQGAMLLGVSAQGGAAVLTEPKLFTAMFAGTVSVLPLAGGGTREINRSAVAADFAGDGSSLCLVTLVKSNLFQLEWPQGKILLAPATFLLRNPRVRGTQVVYFQSTPASVADGEIRVMARGSQPRPLVRYKGFTSLSWGPDGKEIWFSTYDGSESWIQAVSLQGATRLLSRHPGPLELVDVDPAGRCLAILSSRMRQAFGRAPGADREVDLIWLDAQTPIGLRADGSQVLLARSEDWELSDNVGLYLRSLNGGPAVHLGTGSMNADLSPDGKWVATFETNDKGQVGVRLIPTGAGASRWYPLTGTAARSDAFWFNPSGGSIDLMEEDTNSFSRLDLATGAIFPLAFSRPVGTTYGQYPRSPDGRNMLLVDNQTSAQSDDALFQFMLFEGEGAAPKLAKGNLKTEVVAGWADNNQEVYLYERNTIPAGVVRWNPLTGARHPFFQIKPSDPSGVLGIRNLTITPSGRAYVYSVVRKLSVLFLIEGLK